MLSGAESDRQYYERIHKDQPEPWNYQRRGAEILRHQTFVRILKERQPQCESVLDIGCSQGQLTARLSDPAREVFAFDISHSAVSKAASFTRGAGIHFLVAKLPGIPFAPDRFAAVISADCVAEFVPEDRKDAAIREIRSVLKRGGTALFSDYLKPERFEAFEALVRRHFKKVTVHYLNDRLWYQFESWFKAVRHWKWVGKMLASVELARAFAVVSRGFGKRGSRHVLIAAQKEEGDPQ